MRSAWNSGLPSQSPEIAKKQYRNVRKEFRAYCNIAWFEMPNWEYDSITVFGTGLGGTSGVYLGDVFVADNLGYNFSQLDLNKKRLTAGLGFHIFWTEDVYYYNGTALQHNAAGITEASGYYQGFWPNFVNTSAVMPGHPQDYYNNLAAAHEVGHQMGLDHNYPFAHRGGQLMTEILGTIGPELTGQIFDSTSVEPSQDTDCGFARWRASAKNYLEP